MATTRFIHFYGTFKNLYEWGRGWTYEMEARWNEFWMTQFPKMSSFRWLRYIPGSGFGECGTLCGRDINIYMHPMGIYGYMSEGGVSCGASLPEEGYKYDYNYVFYDELEELNKICKAAAEWCGGTFTLDTTKEFRVEIPEERHIFTDKATYLHECCERKENPYYKEK